MLGRKLINEISSHTKYEIVNYSLNNKIYDYICDKYFKSSFLDVVRKYKPYFIINTAAMSNVDKCEIEKEQCYISNFLLLKQMVDICKANNIYLIHISTNFVFDGTYEYYDEDNKSYNPVNYYGYTKAKADEYLMSSGIDYNIVRTILVYDNFDINKKPNSFIEKIIKKLKNNEKVYVTVDEFSNPTLVEDLAKSCVLCMNKEHKGIFNIGGGEYMSIYDIAVKIAEIYDFDKSNIIAIRSKDIDRPARRPFKATLNIDKARNILGYNPLKFKDVFSR